MTAPVNNKSSYALAHCLQRLWTDHVTWTRAYMVAAVDERPEAPEAAARLLRSADDIGQLVEEHYERRHARRITKLLKQHVMVMVDLVDAARNVDKAKFKDIDAVWTSSADDFVDALCALNFSWPKPEMAALWNLHRVLTKEQLAARLEQNFDHDIDTFDQIVTAILAFADHMADGILKQFADKFAA